MRQKIIVIISVILSFFIGAGGMYFLIKYTPSTAEKVFRDTKNVTITESDSIYEAINKIYDAVVVIETSNNSQKIGSGTGFIYEKDEKYGYVITNNHVVEGGNKVNVVFTNGEVAEAKVLGSDTYADLAVLQISKEHITNIAQIGSSKNTKLGDTVFTIGAPVGSEYSGTVTKGIISGKDRMVSVTLSNQTGDYIMNVMQTDAAINPGNSGGPLVNINGEVIGINSLKLVENTIEGIGFAIPIDDAITVINKLKLGETIVRPLLGVTLIDKTETYALYQYQLIIDKDSPNGVVIAEVSNNSPAKTAGLEKGDIIIKIDNDNVTSRARLRYALYKYTVGDTIKITFYRNGETKTIDVKLDQALK